jgi:tetratricopeptide (TPR) repeat protein
MSRSVLVAAFLLAFLALPLVCLAQSNTSSGNPAGAGVASPTSSVVSVHQLQIPEKARKDCEKGTRRFAAKDAAGSIPEFQKAIKAYPDYYEAYAKLGAAELDLEHWGNAESAFRKAIDLSGGQYAPADFGLGLVLATVTKQFAAAEEIVRAGLEKAPTDVTGHFVLAWVLYSTSRLQEAEENARQAITSNPNASGARLLLAQIHLQQNKFSSVVADLDAYLALGIVGPLDEKVREVRAQAMQALGQGAASTQISAANR